MRHVHHRSGFPSARSTARPATGCASSSSTRRPATQSMPTTRPAHLLRNRFYIGEVVYRGETFRGDHEPILDPALFAAVQAKLAAQAVERRCRIRGLSALPPGRLFDEQGHRMTPTHTNKKGVRYSYYVSQAVLRKRSAGSIGRVPAPGLE